MSNEKIFNNDIIKEESYDKEFIDGLLLVREQLCNVEKYLHEKMCNLDNTDFGIVAKLECVKNIRIDIDNQITGYTTLYGQYINGVAIENQMTTELDQDKPKTLTPHSSKDMGKALSESLSTNANAYFEGLQHARDERYQQMIDELPPIESPMDRRR